MAGHTVIKRQLKSFATTPPRIESLLSGRLFLSPQLVGDRLYFISNLGGAFSLYVMDRGGSVPEPLLPPAIALQNPELIDGYPFYVYPELDAILVMIDRDGDENYTPMLIPAEGGIPQPAFGDDLAPYRVHALHCAPELSTVYLMGFAQDARQIAGFIGHVDSGTLESLGEGPHGPIVVGVSGDGSRVAVIDGYTPGDNVLSLWTRGEGKGRLHGTPIEERRPGEVVRPSSIQNVHFVRGGGAVLFVTTLLDDAYGLGLIDLAHPGEVDPVTMSGAVHRGAGELTGLEYLTDDRYTVSFNIDGVSWLYEGVFDPERLEMRLGTVLVGEGELSGGTLQSARYDTMSGRFALSFSTAVSPTQLYTLEREDRHPVRRTRERVLGIPAERLSPGEDASFTSYDGLRISARLYLPSSGTGSGPPYPLVYYIHGGPQDQERPNFAWFSMPLIQFFTLNGFAVFTPNARGSSGYGISYMKRVDHDWGGADRLDHVEGMKALGRDARIDTSRAAVMGRSYGGYMTLTLATRHPQLWSAAVDMFGPYDLLTFSERLPEAWKPYMRLQIGDPATERDFLAERSPSTYMDHLACPLLVIQGQNDPRVVERESRDLVERLRAAGKEVEYLVFENEGHDVLKLENRVRCYTTIVDFVKKHLSG